MSPLKPTRSTSKRVGPPKQGSPQSQPTSDREAGTLRELPTDMASLAVILESAMASGTTASQGPTPNSQLPGADLKVGPYETDYETDDVARSVGRGDPNVGPDTGDDTAAAVEASAAGADLQVGPPSGEPSEREAAAFDEVARSLAAAEACVPLLAQSTGLMRLAALDVVKAETVRAGGLLHLLRFLRGDVNPPMTAVSTSVVTQRIAQAAEAERRLRGIALTSRSSVGDATCTGDETLLANTVLALMLITFAAIEGVQNARVTLSVTVNDEGQIGLAVSQDHIPAPAAWTMKAGSEELPADAAQVVPAIAINAARRLAGEWHGRFAMATGDHSSILTLWLPTLRPDDLEPLAH